MTVQTRTRATTDAIAQPPTSHPTPSRLSGPSNPTSTSFLLSLSAAASAVAATVWTVVDDGLLTGPAVMNGSARGTALVALGIAVPLLLGSMAMARRGSLLAVLTWIGSLVYLLYNAFLFLFLTPFNQAFLVYLAMLSTALWSLVAVLRGVDVASLHGRFAGRTVHRLVAAFIWLVVALNAAAWLVVVVPALAGPFPPEFLDGSGATTNATYVQDLAIWLPLMAVAAAWLWRGHPWGILVAGAMLTMWVIEGLGIAVDQWFGHDADPASSLASDAAVVPFVALAGLTLVPLALLVRGVTAGVPPDGARHRFLAALTAGMAVAAYAGVLGLVGGGIDFGAAITARLPWQSPALAGVALLALVAVPMAAAAVANWIGAPRAALFAVAAGLLLLAWIVVQVAVIRSFSWLQPACLAYGVLVTWFGVSANRADAQTAHSLDRNPDGHRGPARRRIQ